MDLRSSALRPATSIALCSRLSQANWLPCGTVMPGKPAEKSQRGESDHVCHHGRGPSLWPVSPGAQASLNRIDLLINILSEAPGNRLL